MGDQELDNVFPMVSDVRLEAVDVMSRRSGPEVG